jgi:beta-galactosidase
MAAGGSTETWLTVRATLAADTSWAAAGHEIAWGQVAVTQRRRREVRPTARTTAVGTGLRIGPAEFDASGTLRAIGGTTVDGPRLDLWRAPTDNDEGRHGEPVAAEWRRIGLHRLRHRLVSLTDSGTALTVTTKVGPAATNLGFLAVYRWTADDDRVRLDLDVRPAGGWIAVLPRIGVRMAVPSGMDHVTWFGAGPGESYPDSHRAARVGQFESTVDEWQTPYVFPQENGNRSGVRWATLTGTDGSRLRIDGDPSVNLTIRRWTSEDLDAALHTTDLRAGNKVWVNLDVAQQGLGSASCGPGVLPEHQLVPAPCTLRVVFSEG